MSYQSQVDNKRALPHLRQSESSSFRGNLIHVLKGGQDWYHNLFLKMHLQYVWGHTLCHLCFTYLLMSSEWLVVFAALQDKAVLVLSPGEKWQRTNETERCFKELSSNPMAYAFEPVKRRQLFPRLQNRMAARRGSATPPDLY